MVFMEECKSQCDRNVASPEWDEKEEGSEQRVESWNQQGHPEY